MAPTVAVTIVCSVCRASIVSATAFGAITVPRVGRTKARTYKPSGRATTSDGGKTVKIELWLARSVRAAAIRALLVRKPVVMT